MLGMEGSPERLISGNWRLAKKLANLGTLPGCPFTPTLAMSCANQVTAGIVSAGLKCTGLMGAGWPCWRFGVGLAVSNHVTPNRQTCLVLTLLAHLPRSTYLSPPRFVV